MSDNRNRDVVVTNDVIEDKRVNLFLCDIG